MRLERYLSCYHVILHKLRTIFISTFLVFSFTEVKPHLPAVSIYHIITHFKIQLTSPLYCLSSRALRLMHPSITPTARLNSGLREIMHWKTKGIQFPVSTAEAKVHNTLIFHGKCHMNSLCAFNLVNTSTGWAKSTKLRDVFRNLPNIWDKDFCKNSKWLKTINCFRKKLHLKCLKGFSIHFWSWHEKNKHEK